MTLLRRFWFMSSVVEHIKSQKTKKSFKKVHTHILKFIFNKNNSFETVSTIHTLSIQKYTKQCTCFISECLSCDQNQSRSPTSVSSLEETSLDRPRPLHDITSSVSQS